MHVFVCFIITVICDVCIAGFFRTKKDANLKFAIERPFMIVLILNSQ